MGERELHLLSKANWDDISLRLLEWTTIMASKRPLPVGYEARDVVQLAIARLFTNRGWNSVKHPDLFVHLKWIVKSLLSNKGLYDLEEGKKLSHTDDLTTLDVIIENDEDTLVEEENQLYWQVLEEEFAEDSEMKDYIAALRLGETKPKRIAELTGLPVSRVYELPRKLDGHRVSLRARIETLRKEGSVHG